MARLHPIACPDCGKQIVSEEYAPNDRGGAPAAQSYDDCLRKCAGCGLGFSNAREPSAAVAIRRDPRLNVPEQVRENVLDTLGGALNVRNRGDKVRKFAFETSEDAVTWTVFRYLQMTASLGRLAEASPACSRLNAPDEPSLLLWGVPVPGRDERAQAVRERLEAILLRIGENPQSFSEPDVILDLGPAGVVLIEVKYRSPNDDTGAGYRGWPTYLGHTDAFVDPGHLRDSGLYELARNWRIGWELAEGRPLVLVNLGPPSLFTGSENARLDGFRRCLRTSETRQFELLPWPRFLMAAPNQDAWFVEYSNERGLHLADPRARLNPRRNRRAPLGQ